MPTASERDRIRYYERRAWAIDLLGGACIACGATADLEIDHIDPATKSYEIGSRLARYSKDRILVELLKCQLLCVEHHRAKSRREARARVTHGKYHAAYHLRCDCDLCAEFKRTYVRADRPKKGPKPIEHGTRAGYLKEGRQGLPRCEACKAANVAYTLELRRRKRLPLRG